MADRDFSHEIMRRQAEPPIGLPLAARSVGHCRASPGWRAHVSTPPWVQIIWAQAGSGMVMIRGEPHCLPAGKACLLFPNTDHTWYALDGAWEFRHYTLDGPAVLEVAAGVGITDSTVRDVGTFPILLFKQLESTLIDQRQASERRASVLAYALLVDTSRFDRTALEEDRLVAEALAIIHQQWQNSHFGVDALAGELGQHRSTLTRRFHAALGDTISAYIANLRMMNALRLLRRTSRRVADIARACGYADPNYFSRLVHSRTGLTPSQIRKGHGFP